MTRLIPLLLLAFTLPALAGGDDPKNPANWVPVRIKGRTMAPEFVDIDAWLNSKPLSMAELKGKVVVVHFMAFG